MLILCCVFKRFAEFGGWGKVVPKSYQSATGVVLVLGWGVLTFLLMWVGGEVFSYCADMS